MDLIDTLCNIEFQNKQEEFDNSVTKQANFLRNFHEDVGIINVICPRYQTESLGVASYVPEWFSEVLLCA